MMSTRARIGIETDGYIRSIYCHHDGGLWHVGRVLHEHYADPAKIAALIDLGDISALGINVAPPDGAEHSYAEPVDGVTVAYHRDRGERRERTSAQTHNMDDWPDDGVYRYLYRDGAWSFRYLGTDWEVLSDGLV
jgi:hypothetical protein